MLKAEMEIESREGRQQRELGAEIDERPNGMERYLSGLPPRLDPKERTLLADCEARLEKNLGATKQALADLAIIHDLKLYREEFRTFEEYCDKKWDLTPHRVRQLMRWDRVLKILELPGGKDQSLLTSSPTNNDFHAPTTGAGGPASDAAPVLPATESQARPLAPLLKKPAKVKEAWARARAKAGPGKEPSAKQIKESVAEVSPSVKRRSVEASEGLGFRALQALEALKSVFAAIEGKYNPDRFLVFSQATYHLRCAESEFHRIAREERKKSKAEEAEIDGRERAQKSTKEESDDEESLAAARKRPSAAIESQGGPFIVMKKHRGEAEYLTHHGTWNSIRGRAEKFATSAEAAVKAIKVGKVVRL